MLQDGDTALLLAVDKDNADEAVPVVQALLKRKDIDANARNQVCMGQYQANSVRRAVVGVIGPWRVPHALHNEWLLCCRMATLRCRLLC
mgnify:CR=1 FL=1